ncbi:hypothetical protein [Poseidonocella sp. HB161398]|uniref:hypothetical protein n=1 Tax=Poseidonocella sp. HB161398 TaxID=2320855 RepID=UPI0011082299|nr:hypothetical protein [Poseidonocella sp. HB161398]
MKKLLLATTVIMSMSGAAFAQTASSMDRSQLETIAEDAFTENQISYDVDMLSEDQLAQIRDAVEEKDGGDLRSELYVIIGPEYEPNYDPAVDNALAGTGEPSQLQALAEDTLRQSGIAYDVTKLDASQLAAIKNVAEEGAAGNADSELWSIIGFENRPDIPDPIGDSVTLTQAERGQLEILAYDMLSANGVPYDVDKISNSQLVEIKTLSEEDSASADVKLKSILGVES